MADAGVELKVTLPELKSVTSRIGAVALAIHHPVKLMNIVGAVLESAARKRFRTGVGPDGKAWKPSIRAQRTGGKTLLDHGHLRDSISHEADDDKAVIGSNLIYAAIHQMGGVIKAKSGGALVFNIPGVGWRRVAQVTIPARPYLGVSEADRVEISDQVERYIARAAA